MVEWKGLLPSRLGMTDLSEPRYDMEVKARRSAPDLGCFFPRRYVCSKWNINH
jgi:hypothetical protein